MSSFPYSDDQRTLLISLIKEANPDIDEALLNAVSFGTPTAITPPTTGFPADTSITLFGNSEYNGSINLTYRRINLTTLFKGMTLQLTNYASTTSLPGTVTLPTLNAKYGLSLAMSDDPTYSWAFSTSGNNPRTMPASSLCYTGSFSCQWVKGKQNITDIIPKNTQLVGLTYLGGNTFDSNRKPQGEYLMYGYDFSDSAYLLNGLTSGTLTNTNTSHVAIVNQLVSISNGYFNTNTDNSVGSLYGLTFNIYTIPNTAVPEANSDVYNTVLAINSTSTSWLQGSILVHYNK